MNGNIKASFNVDYINVSFLPVRQEVFDLYDYYVHGKIDRRGFMNRLSVYAVGGLTVSALMSNLMPNYAQAQQVKPDYNRIKTEYAEYGSPKGGGKMRGLLAKPAGNNKKLPGVIVVHENRGLNPYIEDVTRILAVDGFIAFALFYIELRLLKCFFQKYFFINKKCIFTPDAKKHFFYLPKLLFRNALLNAD